MNKNSCVIFLLGLRKFFTMDITLNERIACFVQLGKDLSPNSQWFRENIATAFSRLYQSNGWFTEASVTKACEGLNLMLHENDVVEWLSEYHISTELPKKRVAIIMAGNIPFVGFHDLLCVLIAGHSAIVKLSSEDSILPTIIIQRILELEPRFESYIRMSDTKLLNFDAVIATGSNNTARYFEAYFGKYPHIIRKSRSSVAVLDGAETTSELQLLGNDILDFFGLGCRNVSKLYVPTNYTFDALFEAVYEKKEVININKYASNYDYNRAVYLMNSIPFLDNNFLIIKQGNDLHTPVSVIHYEFYDEIEKVQSALHAQQEEIQCIVSHVADIKPSVNFGESQKPRLWDYADQVDTLRFLLHL